MVLTALPTCIPAGKYGVEQFTALRSQFGPNGSRLVYFLAVVFLTMGWLAVLGMMFGRSIDGLTALVSGGEANPLGPKVMVAAVGAILLTWFVVAKGPTSIKFFNMVISPALVLLMGWMMYLILSQHSFAALMALKPLAPPFDDHTLNFVIAVEVNLAAGFSWWPYIGNLGRLTRNERTAFWPNIVGIFGAAALGEIVGLLGSVALGNSDPTIWMAQVGGMAVGVVALGFVALANVTSMANILYTSVVGLRQIGTRAIHDPSASFWAASAPPPLRVLPDGRGCAGGGGQRVAGARAGRAAGHRQLGLSERAQRQPERADDHAGRACRRHGAGPAAPAAVERRRRPGARPGRDPAQRHAGAGGRPIGQPPPHGLRPPACLVAGPDAQAFKAKGGAPDRSPSRGPPREGSR